MNMCNSKGGCVMSMLSKILVIVGGLNWGLVGVGMLIGNGMNLNLVSMLLGAWPVLEAIVYVLVGIAAVVQIFSCGCKKCSDSCGKEGMEKSM